MNNVVRLSPADYTGAQLELIKRTVAHDCNSQEFDLFIEVARRAGLDPFRRQIMALIFSKDDAAKRRMSIITGIDGLRAIADRSGTYTPDDEEPDFTYDEAAKDANCNPLGLVRARVCVFKNGKKVPGVAYWDEFAPIKEDSSEGYDWIDTGEVWPDTGKPKKRKVAREGSVMIRKLDTSGQWAKMGRVMLAKCAEAQALRKAYPEDLSGLYEGSELDRAQVVDLSPSEIIGHYQTEGRLERIGAAGGITFQLFPNSALESIPLGQVADRVIETLKSFSFHDQFRWFESANTYPLREFWARAPGDALEVKKVMEAVGAKLLAEAQNPKPAA